MSTGATDERRAAELRETQQVVDQLPGRRGSLDDAVEIVLRLLVSDCLAIAQQLGVADDVPERRAQIVLDRIGERLELLVRALQLLVSSARSSARRSTKLMMALRNSTAPSTSAWPTAGAALHAALSSWRTSCAECRRSFGACSASRGSPAHIDAFAPLRGGTT